MTFSQALELPLDLFHLMLKNSVVAEYESTEEGREYLEKCDRMKQTQPDRAALRKKFGNTGGEKNATN